MKNEFWIYVHKAGIYSKTVFDNTPPRLFYDGDKDFSCYIGKGLQSILGEECLISMKDPILTIIRVEEKTERERIFEKGSVEVLSCSGDENSDFDVLNDKQILLLTLNNNLSLIDVGLSLNGSIKTKVIDEIEIEGLNGVKEKSKSIAVCDRGKCFIVNQVRSEDVFSSTSVSIYEILNDGVILKKGILDVRDQILRDFYCISFVGYSPESVIFLAMQSGDSKETQLLTYAYKEQTREIQEVTSLRKKMKIDRIFKFADRGNGEIVGVSSKSELICVEFK